MFKPIRTKRAYENIVNRIEQSMVEGQLQIGDQLPSERELADTFQVSRVVIREAIRVLEAKGTVEVRHGSGTYIAAAPNPAIAQSFTLLLQLEEASLLDLYVVRQALELVSASRAAQYATAEDIQSLRRCMQELLELAGMANDSEKGYLAFIDKDTEFHRLLAEASHNLPLATLIQAILPLMNSARLELVGQVNTAGLEGWTELKVRHKSSDILTELAHVLTAVENRDPKAAEHFIYLHLQQAIAGFRDLGA